MNDSPLPYRWSRKTNTKSKRKTVAKLKTTLDDDTFMANAAEQLVTPAHFDKAAYAGTCIHAVNGVELVTDTSGIAYWPATQTLLVADLHLEKGSSFARRGQLLPPYDTVTTLKRLEDCLTKWQPERVVALGDSFHDPHASARLTDASHQMLAAMMAGREWVWITGNHDPEPPTGLDGTVSVELREGGLVLRHEPQVGAEAGEIAGHLHPKARLLRRGRMVKRSCFAADRKRMILPSFGAYTGGLNVFDPAYDGLFDGRAFHALMRGDGQVYRISAEDLS